MTEGKYYSKKENRYCRLYNNWSGSNHYVCECDICGKNTKNPTSIIWEDDEDGLEWMYGGGCLKELQLRKVKEEA